LSLTALSYILLTDCHAHLRKNGVLSRLHMLVCFHYVTLKKWFWTTDTTNRFGGMCFLVNCN